MEGVKKITTNKRTTTQLHGYLQEMKSNLEKKLVYYHRIKDPIPTALTEVNNETEYTVYNRRLNSFKNFLEGVIAEDNTNKIMLPFARFSGYNFPNFFHSADANKDHNAFSYAINTGKKKPRKRRRKWRKKKKHNKIEKQGVQNEIVESLEQISSNVSSNTAPAKLDEPDNKSEAEPENTNQDNNQTEVFNNQNAPEMTTYPSNLKQKLEGFTEYMEKGVLDLFKDDPKEAPKMSKCMKRLHRNIEEFKTYLERKFSERSSKDSVTSTDMRKTEISPRITRYLKMFEEFLQAELEARRALIVQNEEPEEESSAPLFVWPPIHCSKNESIVEILPKSPSKPLLSPELSQDQSEQPPSDFLSDSSATINTKITAEASETPATAKSAPTTVSAATTNANLATGQTRQTPIQRQTPENTKEKCHKFLANLLELCSREPKQVEQNVRTLVQELIDTKVEPEEFCDRLVRLLKVYPQPYLIEFLKKTLPLLRQSLITKELVINGIRPPPANSALQASSSTNQHLEAFKPYMEKQVFELFKHDPMKAPKITKYMNELHQNMEKFKTYLEEKFDENSAKASIPITSTKPAENVSEIHRYLNMFNEFMQKELDARRTKETQPQQSQSNFCATTTSLTIATSENKTPSAPCQISQESDQHKLRVPDFGFDFSTMTCATTVTYSETNLYLHFGEFRQHIVKQAVDLLKNDPLKAPQVTEYIEKLEQTLEELNGFIERRYLECSTNANFALEGLKTTEVLPVVRRYFELFNGFLQMKVVNHRTLFMKAKTPNFEPSDEVESINSSKVSSKLEECKLKGQVPNFDSVIKEEIKVKSSTDDPPSQTPPEFDQGRSEIPSSESKSHSLEDKNTKIVTKEKVLHLKRQRDFEEPRAHKKKKIDHSQAKEAGNGFAESRILPVVTSKSPKDENKIQAPQPDSNNNRLVLTNVTNITKEKSSGRKRNSDRDKSHKTKKIDKHDSKKASTFIESPKITKNQKSTSPVVSCNLSTKPDQKTIQMPQQGSNKDNKEPTKVKNITEEKALSSKRERDSEKPKTQKTERIDKHRSKKAAIPFEALKETLPVETCNSTKEPDQNKVQIPQKNSDEDSKALTEVTNVTKEKIIHSKRQRDLEETSVHKKKKRDNHHLKEDKNSFVESSKKTSPVGSCKSATSPDRKKIEKSQKISDNHVVLTNVTNITKEKVLNSKHQRNLKETKAPKLRKIEEQRSKDDTSSVVDSAKNTLPNVSSKSSAGSDEKKIHVSLFDNEHLVLTKVTNITKEKTLSKCQWNVDKDKVHKEDKKIACIKKIEEPLLSSNDDALVPSKVTKITKDKISNSKRQLDLEETKAHKLRKIDEDQSKDSSADSSKDTLSIVSFNVTEGTDQGNIQISQTHLNGDLEVLNNVTNITEDKILLFECPIDLGNPKTEKLIMIDKHLSESQENLFGVSHNSSTESDKNRLHVPNPDLDNDSLEQTKLKNVTKLTACLSDLHHYLEEFRPYMKNLAVQRVELCQNDPLKYSKMVKYVNNLDRNLEDFKAFLETKFVALYTNDEISVIEVNKIQKTSSKHSHYLTIFRRFLQEEIDENLSMPAPSELLKGILQIMDSLAPSTEKKNVIVTDFSSISTTVTKATTVSEVRRSSSKSREDLERDEARKKKKLDKNTCKFANVESLKDSLSVALSESEQENNKTSGLCTDSVDLTKTPAKQFLKFSSLSLGRKEEQMDQPRRNTSQSKNKEIYHCHPLRPILNCIDLKHRRVIKKVTNTC